MRLTKYNLIRKFHVSQHQNMIVSLLINFQQSSFFLSKIYFS